MQPQPDFAPIDAKVEAKSATQIFSMAEETSRTQRGRADVWKTIELLDVCFPSVASAICLAAEQVDQKLEHWGRGKLVKIASV